MPAVQSWLLPRLTRSTTCKKCPAGHISNRNGLETSCYPCPAGKYATSDANLPDRYPYVVTEAANFCMECPVGRYQDQAGQYICNLCQPGKYTDDNYNMEVLSTTTIQPIAGPSRVILYHNGIIINAESYAPHTLSTSCKDCPIGDTRIAPLETWSIINKYI